MPPRKEWTGRITPTPQPLSSAAGHREGIPFMIAEASPLCQPLSSGSTDTADTAGIPPASADWPLSAPHRRPSHTKLEDSRALPSQGRGGKGRGGRVCCSLQLGLCSTRTCTCAHLAARLPGQRGCKPRSASTGILLCLGQPASHSGSILIPSLRTW